MDKAFDAVLQSKVDAAVVAKSSCCFREDQFRYQCLCCGEEVYLAAADSSQRTPHFRHRRGNNDTECERYLGQSGEVERFVLLRKQQQEHIEFCFNRDRMTFEICASFSKEELQAYEEKNNIMTVSTKRFSEPFITVPLNKSEFIQNGKSYFTITEFATEYFVSFDSGVGGCIYQDVMQSTQKINIYKVRMQDEHYRHQTSSILYTDTKYIGICENEEVLQKLLSLEYIISEEDLFSFTIGNRIFYGLQFSVKRVEFSVINFFEKYDYQVETSEAFGILWPPVYTRDSKSICHEDSVYVHASFDLIPYGNMNVDGTYVKKINADVLELHMDNEVIIREKNIDICIQKENEIEMETVLEEPVTTYSNIYVVSEQYDYFLFDQNGCKRLIKGSHVYLSEWDWIVGYKNGHLKDIVRACPKEKTDTRQLINDILKYHPQSEMFEPDEFMNITANEIVLSYLENCYRSGQINTVVKRYIKEDLI